MRFLVSLAFLALLLRPVAGAAICLHTAAHEQEKCGMPMSGEEPKSSHPEHGPTRDCAQMAVCASPLPVVFQATSQLSFADLTFPPQYLTPSSLLLGDSAAPPQPPPIA